MTAHNHIPLTALPTSVPDDWFILAPRGQLHELAPFLSRVYLPRSGAAPWVLGALLRCARPGNVENGHLIVWPSPAELAAAANTTPRNVRLILEHATLVNRNVGLTFVPDADPQHVHRPERHRPILLRIALPTPVELHQLLEEGPAESLRALVMRWCGRPRRRPDRSPVGTVVVGVVGGDLS